MKAEFIRPPSAIHSKMGKLTSKLRCASSLFQCFSSKKKHVETYIGVVDGSDEVRVNNHKAKAQADAPKRVSIKTSSHDNADRPLPLRPLSPHSHTSDVMSIGSGSVTSAKSMGSVYYESYQGEDYEWHLAEDSLSDNEDYDDDDDGFSSSFDNLQIDGQFFFSCKDDPSISQDAFEGIKMYPPVPTSEPDAVPRRAHVSVSNMETLLHSYQHEEEDEVADDAVDKIGKAMEHQAQRLLSIHEKVPLDSVFEGTNLLLEELKVPDVHVRERGFPGELTEKELEAVKLLQSELKVRDPIYKDIIQSFSSVEKEAYSLCRFLRARKFDVEKVFAMLDEAKDAFAVAKEKNFYPDLEEALGFSRSVFLSQYPAVFSGNAKNGLPVMYLKAGDIQPEGIKVSAACKDDKILLI